MKTLVKNNQTVTTSDFQIIEGTTKTGKPCLGILTEKRLEKDDFKALMNDIRDANEGAYGFMKYFEKQKKNCIAAIKIEPALLAALAARYDWKDAEKKVKAVKSPTVIAPDKSHKTKKQQAKQAAITDMGIDPKELALFAKFKAMLSE